jgi:hypothetical protein
MKAAALFVVWALAFSPSISAQNLVVNGDFNAGKTAFTSDFAYSPGNLGPPYVYDIVTDGFGNSVMAVNGRADESDPVVWAQTVAVTLAQPYQFSVWTNSWSGGGGNLQLQINGVTLGPEFYSGSTADFAQTSEYWLADSTSATLAIVNTSIAFNGNDFSLDDISFIAVDEIPEAVPEPGTWLIAALAAGLIAGHRVWRRKTATR